MLKFLLRSFWIKHACHENAWQSKKKNTYVPRSVDANAGLWIQHWQPASHKSHSNLVLVRNGWLCFIQLKLLFSLVAEKYGINTRMNLLSQIFELIAKNASWDLVFKWEKNTNGIWSIRNKRLRNRLIWSALKAIKWVMEEVINLCGYSSRENSNFKRSHSDQTSSSDHSDQFEESPKWPIKHSL